MGKSEESGDTGRPHGYRIEAQVGHLLRRAHQRATALFLTHIGNVTPTQFAALVKLRDEPDLSQNHLGRLTAMDPATIQGVVRRLKSRGLVQDRPDPTDARRTLLRLSVRGEDMAARLVPNGTVISEQILAPLRPEERQTLLDLLKRIS